MDSTPPSRWEWAFWLRVEDAHPRGARGGGGNSAGNGNGDGAGPCQTTILVAGSDAEYLLDMTATDLRENSAALNRLREKLWILWGEVEEYKKMGLLDGTQLINNNNTNNNTNNNNTNNNNSINNNSNNNSNTTTTTTATTSKDIAKKPPANKPFDCCIQEYGLPDESGDGGGGEREGAWVQCRRLIKTTIKG